MPTPSFRTLATGARQLVVQDALRDDLVLGLEARVVHAVDDGHVHAVGRRRDQHLLRTGVEMPSGRLALGEDARALEHESDSERAPRKLRQVLLGDHLDRPGADVHDVALELDAAMEPPMHAVVAEQVSVGRRWCEIVDGHHLDVVAPTLGDRTQDVAADAPEAVDGDPHRHLFPPSFPSAKRRFTSSATASAVMPKCL